MDLPYPQEWPRGVGRGDERCVEDQLTQTPVSAAENSMSTVSLEEMQQDHLVMSVARAFPWPTKPLSPTAQIRLIPW